MITLIDATQSSSVAGIEMNTVESVIAARVVEQSQIPVIQYKLTCGYLPHEEQCDRQGNCEGCEYAEPILKIQQGETLIATKSRAPLISGKMYQIAEVIETEVIFAGGIHFPLADIQGYFKPSGLPRSLPCGYFNPGQCGSIYGTCDGCQYAKPSSDEEVKNLLCPSAEKASTCKD